MPENSISCNRTRNIGIIITLIVVPIVYLGIIKYSLSGLFNNSANIVMFLLYNMPFWFLLMIITGMELYRQTITRHFSRIPFAYLVMAGSILIGIVGIVISPVGPGLFSQGALVLIVTNLLLGTVVGVITGLQIRWRLRRG